VKNGGSGRFFPGKPIKLDRAIFLGCLSLLPAWLGGAPGPVGLGILGLALAVYFYFFPPGEFWKSRWKWFWVAAVCWPLLGWLPRLFPASWHAMLGEAGLATGWCWHPQPLLLWNAWLMMLLGFGWILALFGRPLGSRESHRALRCFAVGVMVLAVMGLGTGFDHIRVPWWEPGQGLGPFPNRNQSGNLYALSALMLLGLAAHEVRNKRVYFWVWMGGVVFLFGATVVNGSRAGVILFLAGVAIWSLWQLGFTQNKSRAGLLCGGALLFLAAFLFIGGEALNRLHAMIPGESGELANPLGGRWEIWRDTLALWFSSPLRGIGLGNFSDLSGLFRSELITEKRVLHPESDVLWWLSELGWPGLVFIGAGLYWAALPFFKNGHSKGRRLRSVAMVACLCFLLHGLVDVSAHRLGSLFPALFFLRLTWPPKKLEVQPERRSFRDLRVAVGAGLIGLWFLLPALGWLPLPSTGFSERVRAKWTDSFTRSPAQSVEWIDRALRVHPLDWELRYAYGVSLWADGKDEEAWQAFKQVRLLEPGNSDVAFAEGKLWMGRDAGKAWVAWREALKRRTLNPHGLLKQMLQESRGHPELQEALLFLASHIPELRHLVLARLTDSEFKSERESYFNELGVERPEDGEVMRSVLENWARRGGGDEVLSFLKKNPQWNLSGWPVAARVLMDQKRFEEATRFMREVLPPPRLPQLSDDENRRRWHLDRLLRGSNDPVSLYSFLYFDSDEVSLSQGQQWIQRCMKGRKAPAFFHFLVGEYQMRHENWEGAARAFLRYGHMAESR